MKYKEAFEQVWSIRMLQEYFEEYKFNSDEEILKRHTRSDLKRMYVICYSIIQDHKMSNKLMLSQIKKKILEYKGIL